jgi:hypothetical protein
MELTPDQSLVPSDDLHSARRTFRCGLRSRGRLFFEGGCSGIFGDGSQWR